MPLPQPMTAGQKDTLFGVILKEGVQKLVVPIVSHQFTRLDDLGATHEHSQFLRRQCHVLGLRRLARHQLDGGCRQLRAAPAGTTEFGHHLLGEEGHLLLDLPAAEARHLEVA